MNEQIEQWVRRFPEQYNWGYRRFSNHVYESANQE
jgi:lauroyl/myristoyl acyltransferase